MMRHFIFNCPVWKRSSVEILSAFALMRRGQMMKGLLSALLLFGVSTAAHAEEVTYTYDLLGRVASISYSSGTVIVYSYDLNGNRATKIVNINTTFGVWGNFNWSAALWHSTTPSAIWNNFNWNAATWSP